MKHPKIIMNSVIQSIESAEARPDRIPRGVSYCGQWTKPSPAGGRRSGPVHYRQIARWAVAVMILAGMVAVSPGQRRPRGEPLRIIQLPQPKLTHQGGLSFEEAVVKHRIVRQLSNQPISFEQMGQLAWAGQGIAEPSPQASPRMRGSLSARQMAQQMQMIYPISLFFASPGGVHVYKPDGHSLEQIFDRDVRGTLASAVSNPEVVATAGCCLIIAGPIRDPAGRPAAVVRRLVLLQAGQTAQNIQLQAASLSLATVPISEFDSRNVARTCNLPRTLEPLYMISVGYPVESADVGAAAAQQPAVNVPSAQNRTVLRTAVLIVSGEDFDDRELFETMRVLNTSGVQTVIASTRLGVIRGMMGGIAEAGILVSQLRIDDFNAVIFIGGNGAREYYTSPDALNIARDAVARKKILAAISTAPVILANAGVLRNIRATGYTTEKAILQQAGAVYTGNHVERDGLIITSTGQIAVVQFAAAIAEALAGR